MRPGGLTKLPALPVVVEAPESVALLLYSCHTVNDTAMAEALQTALEHAASAAADTIGRHYTLGYLHLHDIAEADPSFPRPHAHIEVRERVEITGYHGWARAAHARYQGTLQAELLDAGIGVTRDYPSPHGWEITAAIPQLGKLERVRCPFAGRAVFPLELEAAAAQRRHAS